MEIARLRSFLRQHRRVALDSCFFIYQWEANPRYSPLTDWVFHSLERSDFDAITSTITVTELLVHPYRDNDVARVNDLFGLFSTYPNLEWIAPHLEIASRAAEIRAQYRLRTPDALQAATALHANATAFLTNDSVFQPIRDLDVLILDDFASAPTRT